MLQIICLGKTEEMAGNNDMDVSDDQTMAEDVKTAGQPLSDFLLQLEDYTPTVRIFCFF